MEIELRKLLFSTLRPYYRVPKLSWMNEAIWHKRITQLQVHFLHYVFTIICEFVLKPIDISISSHL